VRLNKKPELESYLSEDLPDPKARKAKYLSIMDKIQTPRSLPVALYFCQDLLTNKDLMGIKRSGEMKDGCTLHTGIMVGRRRNATGGCDVLIRNSWGASCSGYDWNCERGQVWVDEDRLLDNMAAMVSYP
jgi:hypothetical protein